MKGFFKSIGNFFSGIFGQKKKKSRSNNSEFVPNTRTEGSRTSPSRSETTKPEVDSVTFTPSTNEPVDENGQFNDNDDDIIRSPG